MRILISRILIATVNRIVSYLATSWTAFRKFFSYDYEFCPATAAFAPLLAKWRVGGRLQDWGGHQKKTKTKTKTWLKLPEPDLPIYF